MTINISGGPLLINGILVGVASSQNGPICEGVEGKHPNVYTDVSQYVKPFLIETSKKPEFLILLLNRHSGSNNTQASTIS